MLGQTPCNQLVSREQERIWKEAIVAYLSIFLEGLWKAQTITTWPAYLMNFVLSEF
jgi:hypothetical protein